MTFPPARRALPAAALLALALAACGDDGGLPLPLPDPEPTPEAPREFAGTVTDRFDGEPVADAYVEIADAPAALSDAAGAFAGSAMRGAAVRVTAEGYDPVEAEVPDEGDLAVELRPNVVSGTVMTPDATPIAGARVFLDGSEEVVVSDEAGAYRLTGVPEEGLIVYKAAGYAIAEAPIDEEMEKDVTLTPFVARALYAPASVFETAGRLDAMLELIERTEVNAMVIDVKETGGNLYYATDLPEAEEIGAVMAQPVFDLDELLPMLRERGIYTIARMVVMKDNTLGTARPELAVRNTVTGEPWRDGIGGIWLDPNQPGVAEYTTAVATDLADRGFDEVQLDYIRFFSDGPYDQAATLLPNAQSHRLPGIRRVMRMVSDAFEHRRAFLSADVFPISFLAPDDQGIGQRPEVIMPYVDYFSPMVYPSHYGPGVFGFDVPNEYPYEVVARSLEVMREQAAGLPLVIRPWIQDFGYGSFRAYTEADLRAQMQAIEESGGQGWMIWNAQARFTEAALDPPEAPPSPDPSGPPGPSPSEPPEAPPAASPIPSPAP